jgi:hypothetical protein
MIHLRVFNRKGVFERSVRLHRVPDVDIVKGGDISLDGGKYLVTNINHSILTEDGVGKALGVEIAIQEKSE